MVRGFVSVSVSVFLFYFIFLFLYGFIICMCDQWSWCWWFYYYFPYYFGWLYEKENVVHTSNDHDFQEYIMYINLTGGCSVLMFNLKKKIIMMIYGIIFLSRPCSSSRYISTSVDTLQVIIKVKNLSTYTKLWLLSRQSYSSFIG